LNFIFPDPIGYKVKSKEEAVFIRFPIKYKDLWMSETLAAAAYDEDDTRMTGTMRASLTVGHRNGGTVNALLTAKVMRDARINDATSNSK